MSFNSECSRQHHLKKFDIIYSASKYGVTTNRQVIIWTRVIRSTIKVGKSIIHGISKFL
mgnify:CR=1 FL=1